MSQDLPVGPDDELCEILGSLPEKFIVDFANGIDVVRDVNAVQRQRQSMYARLYDGFSGRAQERQNLINASLADGVAGSLAWLTELTTTQAKSNHAIGQVRSRVILLQRAIGKVANHSADTQDQLKRLEQQLTLRCNDLEQEVARINLVQRATLQLDLVMSKWEAGRYASLSPAGRCYAALEELRWGAFGDFYRGTARSASADLVELLCNRSVAQLAADIQGTGRQRIDTSHWLRQDNTTHQPDVQLALAYLGDWASAERTPFVFAAVNLPAELPSHLPRLCTAERLAFAMTAEVFSEQAA